MAPKRSAREAASALGTAAVKPTKASSGGPKGSKITAEPTTLTSLLGKLGQDYQRDTQQRIKLIDCFLTFLLLVGALQFLYCVLAGNYPFNAFLSGFSATVGQFVLTVSLRIQTNPENKDEFKRISPERAFADYVFGSLILHFFCVNFIN
ncbi:BgTH12-06014 [Blumeria graminis f. sp. triticale]|uniref:Dolichyl-diphosphooligosaccharide--protein glycosyltransferase subunit OST2 n=3 Tax=Blumeria graminis TaxID=34373 RepID=A0A381LC34_BLUGR|nr:Epsilon subunit of the oligosaccharyltransferase complex of the ER lumen [Blumeria graminis f. sp. tritici 96224]CAD6504281.1 BgTH12-06014 [Blumeria graminis f. sp. triticale]VDB91088.1 Bgt-1959 [Blumeria graminis f. sp. tritici]